MKSSLFPDVNVWLALTHSRHIHHGIAADWFLSLDNEAIFFCRFTQLGLLRLLTNRQVMGAEVMSQRRSWRAYRRWFEDERVEFHREPESAEFERLFEEYSSRSHPSPKLWADAYLAAFARVAGFRLVTFDRGFVPIPGLTIELLPGSAAGGR